MTNNNTKFYLSKEMILIDLGRIVHMQNMRVSGDWT